MKKVFPNKAKIALRERVRLIGCWCGLTNHLSTELIGQVGFDWLLIDCEHASNDVGTLIPQLMALKDSHSFPFVRPTWNDKVEIKRLLDIGFYNFLVPFVATREQAEQAVSYTRYPTQGVRGVSVAHRSNNWGFEENYQSEINDNITVVVQIEDREGVENIKDILDVDGVDAVFIGPSDLAASYGYLGNAKAEEVQRAIEHVFNAASAANKSVGILAPNNDDARFYLECGANFVAVGSDIGLLKNATVELKNKFME
ncbi:aldolase/citrate lyase family protein [Vibrio mediterranei]|uniref:aldolase/citrate lyase family protein n=1 Tax=Vibrio mediterranei TaxID=689 RepID=UPI001EFC742D|nr:aldolase/citrate lyase family protein [Vibrio mediterranei]MCG9625210.1 aldolase/citrate lyase family protein [Vibrio mediterranei]